MSFSATDRRIIRDLARRVAEIAALPEQAEKIRLWTTCNDLKPERPMVLATQQPVQELDKVWLKMECEGEAARTYEYTLRQVILRHEHVPDDLPILGLFRVAIPILGWGYDDYGVRLLTVNPQERGGAYHIEPVISSEDDLKKLHPRPVRADHEAAERNVTEAEELLGDILRVQEVGRMGWRYGLSRVLIHMRGLDRMMLDMYDNPGLIHALMAFLRDDYMREIDVLEADGVISLNNTPDNITGSGGLSPTTDLPGKDYDGVPKTKHCICWAESQETVGVGPAQFDEFVLQYQIPLMRRFGLVDYGCCEPLDCKLDLLKANIPNLRWVAVAPWADRQVAAEKLGKDYVYVFKPNPSHICSQKPNWELAETEIRETIEIARGCPMHIVMKDTMTFWGDAKRTTMWCDMAVRVAKETA